MALALLGNVCGRAPRSIGGKTPEGIRPSPVGEIVETTAADVRHVDPKAELMLSARIGQEISVIEVIFGSSRVGLCTTSGECSCHYDLRVRIQTGYRTIVMTHQKSRLVYPVRRKQVMMAYIDLVLLKLSISASARQHGATNPLVLYSTFLVRVPDPELIAVCEVVKDTTRSKEMVRGIRYILINQAVDPFSLHDGLLII